MSSPHVVPASDQHVPAIAALVASTPLWQRYGVTPGSAAEALRGGLQRREAISVLLGADVQGFAWVIARGGFGRTPYLKWIGVSAAAQGSGAGTTLLRAAEASARETLPELMLLCSDFNQGAQRFYEREGYHRVGVLPGYVLPDVGEIIYWKRLA